MKLLYLFDLSKLIKIWSYVPQGTPWHSGPTFVDLASHSCVTQDTNGLYEPQCTHWKYRHHSVLCVTPCCDAEPTQQDVTQGTQNFNTKISPKMTCVTQGVTLGTKLWTQEHISVLQRPQDVTQGPIFVDPEAHRVDLAAHLCDAGSTGNIYNPPITNEKLCMWTLRHILCDAGYKIWTLRHTPFSGHIYCSFKPEIRLNVLGGFNSFNRAIKKFDLNQLVWVLGITIRS